MRKEISSPFGRSDVTTVAMGLRTALKNGAKRALVPQGVTFVEPGEVVVFRVSGGIIMATGEHFTAVANAQRVGIIEDILKAFGGNGVPARHVDLLIQYLTPGASDVLMDEALRADVRSVMAVHGTGDGPPSGQRQKHIMIKRSA